MPADSGSPPPDGHWLERVGRNLADLGFDLVEPDRTAGEETTHLLVALRPQPTLAHFDPDTIDYWVTDGGRGRAATLDLGASYPIAADYAWGQIILADRLDVHNEFLGFGGKLRAELTADGTALIDFASDAPILRWSGHSQAGDPLAAEVGAFFGRIKVPIDFVPGTEALVSQAAPRTLYCAFIQSVRERFARARTLRESSGRLAEWSSREARRMQATADAHWQAAAELQRQLATLQKAADRAGSS